MERIKICYFSVEIFKVSTCQDKKRFMSILLYKSCNAIKNPIQIRPQLNRTLCVHADNFPLAVHVGQSRNEGDHPSGWLQRDTHHIIL